MADEAQAADDGPISASWQIPVYTHHYYFWWCPECNVIVPVFGDRVESEKWHEVPERDRLQLMQSRCSDCGRSYLELCHV